MLRWRLLFGPILIAALVGILVLDFRAGEKAPYLWLLAVLLGIRSTWEMVQLLRTRSFEPSFPLTAICVFAIISTNWLPHYWPGQPWVKLPDTGTGALDPAMLVYALCVMLVFTRGTVRYAAPGKSMETIGAELLILSYVGVFLSLTAQLRWIAATDLGYLPLASVVVATKCGDIFAYTFGRLFGRKKLVPLLSPGKTWAGAWGAIGGAAVGSWVLLQWGAPLIASGHAPSAWYWSMIYGSLIGVVGLVGDLCESLIKRDVGKKDAPSLVPGFGGLLDILDSVIFAAPAAYLLWLVLPL